MSGAGRAGDATASVAPRAEARSSTYWSSTERTELLMAIEVENLLPGHGRLPGLWRPPVPRRAQEGTLKTYLSLGVFYACLWPVVAEET